MAFACDTFYNDAERNNNIINPTANRIRTVFHEFRKNLPRKYRTAPSTRAETANPRKPKPPATAIFIDYSYI